MIERAVPPTYTTQVRLLLCKACGAPLQVSDAGGQVPCQYCRSTNQVGRKARAVPLAPPSLNLDENQRLDQLRAQDGRPLTPPPSLLPLLQGTGLSPAKLEEAFHYFNGSRQEIETTGNPEAQERLFFLCILLNNFLAGQGQHARRRALLETSLEVLTLPRHVQVVRCWLATSAAVEGDMGSAHQWLQPCDPRPLDLMADSAFRTAWAWVYTVEGNFPGVHQVLGATDDLYPVADAWDPVATLLRAHAHESMGNLPLAVQLLRGRMGADTRISRKAMERTRSLYPNVPLCPQSWPLAFADHRRAAARRSGQGVGGTVGLIFMIVGIGSGVLGCLVGGIPTIIAMVAAGVGAGAGAGGAGGALGGLGGGLLGLGITALSTAPFVIIFTGLGWWMRKRALDAAYLQEHGLEVEGRVLDIAATGMRVNDVPMMRVTVEVRHPQMAPYQTTFDQLRSSLGGLTVGEVVPLRVHPEDPRRVVLEVG
jgi:hypothetical protein